MTTEPATPGQPAPTAGSRVLVVGMVALITVGAFEALAVSTAMPVIAEALDGLGLYAAAFSLTLATSVIGMVVAGALADRARPVQPLLVGVVAFALGLLAAGLATSMTVLLVGRALQGLGSGMFIVALYVIVARAFPAGQRAKVLAAFSAAWVVPSLVGPMISGFIVQTFGWRWVFLAVVVIAVPAAVIIVMTTWRVPAPDMTADGASTGPLPWRRFGLATLAGAGVAAMSLGAATDGAARTALVAGGAIVAAVAGTPLLPRGTLRAARGLPTVIALRGIVAAAFFATEVFLPLILQTERHMSPASAGTILTVGAVTWATGSAVRGRGHWTPHDLPAPRLDAHRRRDRRRRDPRAPRLPRRVRLGRLGVRRLRDRHDLPDARRPRVRPRRTARAGREHVRAPGVGLAHERVRPRPLRDGRVSARRARRRRRLRRRVRGDAPARAPRRRHLAARRPVTPQPTIRSRCISSGTPAS